ncbi:MAG: redoxin domain-containing protein [Chloroflexi bacterium]|nr:redoxin domain-containing protein [Chloroflexota bacterium]
MPKLNTSLRPILIVIFGVVLLLAIACGSDSSSAEPTSPVDFVAPTVNVPEDLPPARPTSTPELAADGLIINAGGPELTNNQKWFNSEPTSIGTLNNQGQVVLIDFWTYTCINCIRTLPFLLEWDEKYGGRGLTILGVHAPEFEFEKVADNVQAAIDRYGIQYPVVQDNEMGTWDAFQNRFWPGKYLLDTSGKVIYSHFGEGDYVDTEREIRRALEAAGHDISGIPIGTEEGAARDPQAAGQTRELYGGWGRNYSNQGLYAGQPEYYDEADTEYLYEDNIPHRDGQWYVQGAWLNTREAIIHARETTDYEDYLAFKFQGRSVNVVIDPEGASEPFKVLIELEGRPVKMEDAGEDIEYDADGKSYITVDASKEYRVIELEKWGEREIKIFANSPFFGMSAVTFGSNLVGA